MMVSVSPAIHVEIEAAVDDLRPEGLAHAAEADQRLGLGGHRRVAGDVRRARTVRRGHGADRQAGRRAAARCSDVQLDRRPGTCRGAAPDDVDAAPTESARAAPIETEDAAQPPAVVERARASGGPSGSRGQSTHASTASSGGAGLPSPHGSSRSRSCSTRRRIVARIEPRDRLARRGPARPATAANTPRARPRAARRRARPGRRRRRRPGGRRSRRSSLAHSVSASWRREARGAAHRAAAGRALEADHDRRLAEARRRCARRRCRRRRDASPGARATMRRAPRAAALARSSASASSTISSWTRAALVLELLDRRGEAAAASRRSRASSSASATSGIAEPTRRVQARRDPEGDVLGRWRLRRDRSWRARPSARRPGRAPLAEHARGRRARARGCRRRAAPRRRWCRSPPDRAAARRSRLAPSALRTRGAERERQPARGQALVREAALGTVRVQERERRQRLGRDQVVIDHDHVDARARRDLASRS